MVDDGSTDGSLEVVQAWMDANATRFNRVVLLAHPFSAGVAVARNAGFDAAETPFVLPLDADNVLLPACCERLVEALDGSAAAFAYPRIVHIGDTSELLESGDVRGYFPYVPQRLVASNYIDAMALVRKDAWAAAGGYRQGLSGWEDYDLWCRFAEIGLYGTQVAEDLALYRIHAGSMLHTLTHRGDRLAEVREAIVREHPWLHLESTEPAVVEAAVVEAADVSPSPRPTPRPSTAPPVDGVDEEPDDGRLSARARRAAPPAALPGDGLSARGATRRRARVGRRWPVVAGREGSAGPGPGGGHRCGRPVRAHGEPVAPTRPAAHRRDRRHGAPPQWRGDGRGR